MTARPLTPDELATLNHHFATHGRPRDRLLVALGSTTGLRISELLSLRVRDVVDAGAPANQLRIARRRLKGGRSARARAVKGRVIPLGEAVRALIADQLAALGTLDPEQALFPSRESGLEPMSPVMAYVMLRRACTACGISTVGVSLHSLRRAFAAACWERSRDLLVVQRCLAHASVLTTSIYLSGNDAEADRIMQQVTDALSVSPSVPLPQGLTRAS